MSRETVHKEKHQKYFRSYPTGFIPVPRQMVTVKTASEILLVSTRLLLPYYERSFQQIDTESALYRLLCPV